jgi:hypothetical protein
MENIYDLVVGIEQYQHIGKLPSNVYVKGLLQQALAVLAIAVMLAPQ